MLEVRGKACSVRTIEVRTAFKFVFILLIVRNARLGVTFSVVFDHSVKYF